MIVVDVLLGLNLFVIGVCALRAQLARRGRDAWLFAERPLPVDREIPSEKSRQADGGAVILPFRSPIRTDYRSPESQTSIAQHPSGHPVTNGGG
jgi:hypothetical protein